MLSPRHPLVFLIASAAIGLWTPTVAHAKACGSFKESYRYDVTAQGGETCQHAKRIVKSFIRQNDRWSKHSADDTLAGTYYTNKAYPGWRCGEGSGGGNCRRKKKMALYQTSAAASAARSSAAKLPKVVTGRYQTPPQLRPDAIFYTGNASGALGGSDGTSLSYPGTLKWTKYTRTSARANGVVWFKACLDSCADGSIGSAPATVELDRVKRNRFTRLTIRHSLDGKRNLDRRKPSTRYDGYEIISVKELGPDRLAGCQASGGPDEGEWSVQVTGTKGTFSCDEIQQLVAQCADRTLSGWTVVQNASGIRFASSDDSRGFVGDVAGGTPSCGTVAIYASDQ